MDELEIPFTETNAARYVGVSPAALRFWRAKGRGPLFFRAGDRLIRYRRADLDAWIEARLNASAADVEGR
jgi:predicted DNA-binding transcriptional regulator AlpA